MKRRLSDMELIVFVTGRPVAPFEESLKRVLELPVAVPLAFTAAAEESQASASSLLSLPSSLQRLNTPFPTPQSVKRPRGSPASATGNLLSSPEAPLLLPAGPEQSYHKTIVAVWRLSLSLFASIRRLSTLRCLAPRC